MALAGAGVGLLFPFVASTTTATPITTPTAAIGSRVFHPGHRLGLSGRLSRAATLADSGTLRVIASCSVIIATGLALPPSPAGGLSSIATKSCSVMGSARSSSSACRLSSIATKRSGVGVTIVSAFRCLVMSILAMGSVDTADNLRSVNTFILCIDKDSTSAKASDRFRGLPPFVRLTRLIG